MPFLCGEAGKANIPSNPYYYNLKLEMLSKTCLPLRSGGLLSGWMSCWLKGTAMTRRRFNQRRSPFFSQAGRATERKRGRERGFHADHLPHTSRTHRRTHLQVKAPERNQLSDLLRRENAAIASEHCEYPALFYPNHRSDFLFLPYFH